MAGVNLKKIVSDSRVGEFLDRFHSDTGTAFTVLSDGKDILAEAGVSQTNVVQEHPVRAGNSVIGYVRGPDTAGLVASYLGRVATLEAEKRSLAGECLERYKEINILYDVGKTISSNLDLDEVAGISLKEVERIFGANLCFIMLREGDDKTFRTVKSTEKGKAAGIVDLDVTAGTGIMGSVVLSGNPELVNELDSDPRRSLSESRFASLMCVPLKTTEDAVFGLMVMASEAPANYFSADLKMFSAVASQTAVAMDNALLYKTTVEQERMRNDFGLFYIVTIIIFGIGNALPDISKLTGIQKMLASWGMIIGLSAPLVYFVMKIKMPLAALGITREGWRRALTEGALICLAVLPVMGILKYFIGPPDEAFFSWKYTDHYSPGEFKLKFALYVFHSFIQEFATRGVIQGSLQMFMNRSHFIVPIVVVSLMFGISHLHVSVLAASLTFLVSIIFGYVYFRHKNLFGVTLMHYVLGTAAQALGWV